MNIVHNLSSIMTTKNRRPERELDTKALYKLRMLYYVCLIFKEDILYCPSGDPWYVKPFDVIFIEKSSGKKLSTFTKLSKRENEVLYRYSIFLCKRTFILREILEHFKMIYTR